MRRQFIAISAISGATLLGALFGATTPTAMLDKAEADWRHSLPPTSAVLAYIPVGSAPESVEFGRRPLDPALLAGASYAGYTLVLDESTDVEIHGVARQHRRSEPRGEPIEVANALPESRTLVAVHYGESPISEDPASAPAPPAEAQPAEQPPPPAHTSLAVTF